MRISWMFALFAVPVLVAVAQRDALVRLTPAQVEQEGIVSIEAGPGEIVESLTLTASVGSNVDTTVHVNPRVGGLVRAIHKGLGDAVEQGEPLCEIDSVELGRAVGAFRRAKARVDAAHATLEKETALFGKRIAALEELHEGIIQVAQGIYDRERELQEQGITTLRPYLEADKDLQQARLQKDRELTMLRADRDARLLALEVALREEEIELETARLELRTLGVRPGEIHEAEDGDSGTFGHYVIRAPRSGVITDRHVTMAEFVETGTTLFEIQDLSRAWVLASVYEKDLRRVRRGQHATVRMDAFPGLTFEGEVTFIAYVIDGTTRAAQVRIEIENEPVAAWGEDDPLRPGMFGIARLAAASRRAGVIVPEAAIVHEADGSFVFVEREPGLYERRAVRAGGSEGSVVEVVDGLGAGERVVVQGTFTLKSAARRDELGEGG